MTSRILSSTPSYDPRDPPWDCILGLPDGKFAEYGSRGLNRYDRRLTYILLSHLPRQNVAICGRSLAPKQNHADFISLRIGADRAKLIPLSTDHTTFITIQRDGSISIEHKVVDFEAFSKSMPKLTVEGLNNICVQNGCATDIYK